MSALPQNMEDTLGQLAVKNGWDEGRLAEVRAIVEEAYSDHIAELIARRDATRAFGQAYERAKPNDREVYVYVMRAGNGDVKIGISQNPEWRRRCLSRERRGELELVWTSLPRTRRVATDVERTAHEVLCDRRLDGEWFECPASTAIASVSLAEQQLFARAA